MVKILSGALVLLVVLGAALAYFYFFYARPEPVTPPTTSAAVPAEDAGLITYDAVVGTGVEVTPGFDTALMLLYTGSYGDGTVFDSTHSQTPYVLNPDDAKAPLGFKVGLVGMRVGGTRLITIFPNYAGRAQFANQFPADKTIVYKVSLASVIEIDKDQPLTAPPGIPQVQPGL